MHLAWRSTTGQRQERQMDIEVGWVFTCDGVLWLWQTRSRRDHVLNVTVILLVAPASIGNITVRRNFLAVCCGALLLAGCDGLIISDAGPQSKGVVSWPVSQKMPARLRQGGTKKIRRRQQGQQRCSLMPLSKWLTSGMRR
jgi:hypothetical protein